MKYRILAALVTLALILSAGFATATVFANSSDDSRRTFYYYSGGGCNC